MTDLIQDAEFWVRAAYSASGWLSTALEKNLRRHWIDDFQPSALHRTNPAAEVSGIAWLMEHNGGGVECSFVAIVPWQIVNRDRMNFEIADIDMDLSRKTVKLALREKRPNQSVQPMPGSVTPRANE
jgi:hypothetical protein